MRATTSAALALLLVSSLPAGADDPLPPPRAIGPSAMGADGGAAPAPPPSGARVVEGEAMATVSPDYRLAPGDEVEVEVSLPAEAEAANPLKEAKRFLVTPGGALPVSRLRAVRLDGKTVGDVERDVAARLKEAGVAAQAEVFVRVVAHAPRYVYLVGAAYARIPVSAFGPTNVLHVFAQAGEAMRQVDQARVRVLSADGKTRTVDVRSVLAAGGQTPEAMLEPGDTVILAEKPPEAKPVEPTVFILGAVRNPGAYRQLDPQTRAAVTLLQVIAYAGGNTEYAKLNAVAIRHTGVAGPGARVVVSALAILNGQQEDMPLQAGDVVFMGD